jgi:hypothetical protein
MCTPAVSALLGPLVSGGPLGTVLGLITIYIEAAYSFIRIDASYVSILLAVEAPADISRLVIQDYGQDYRILNSAFSNGLVRGLGG